MSEVENFKKLCRKVLFLWFLISALLFLGCTNPLGSDDYSRDPNFNPGRVGESPANTNPPKDLTLSSSWATGDNPASSPRLDWKNPTVRNFDKSQVALGTSAGAEDVVNFSNASSTTSHIFRDLKMVECSKVYYPSVKALDKEGKASKIISHAKGFRYDNTRPKPVGALKIPTFDGSLRTAPTVNWSKEPGSDNCGVASYEMAIGWDEDGDGFDPKDIDNFVDWFQIPGGNSVRSYQFVRDDGASGVSAFTPIFNRKYYTSIRVKDAAKLTSNATSSPGWFTFSPHQVSDLAVWLDGSDSSTHYQDADCSETLASAVGDPIGCWRDKSGSDHHAKQDDEANKPSLASSGITFDGATNILTVASKKYKATSNLSLFVALEAKSQNIEKQGAKPILSFVTSSRGLLPWLAFIFEGPGVLTNKLIHGFDNGTPIVPLSSPEGDRVIVSATHGGDQSRWNAYSFGLHRVANFAIPKSYTKTTVLGVGGDIGNADRRLKGQIQEVIIFERVLSSKVRKKVEGYLACKYDYRDVLDVNHPYYNEKGSQKVGCP